jgi:diguanylate cyclase
LEVVEGLPSGQPRAVGAELVTDILRRTLREADTACRLRTGYFALLLEDTPENGAIWTVERMRRQLAELRSGLTIWAGVACYPAHAFSPEDILGAAEGALVSAREWRQDRIEVAAVAD